MGISTDRFHAKYKKTVCKETKKQAGSLKQKDGELLCPIKCPNNRQLLLTYFFLYIIFMYPLIQFFTVHSIPT